MAEGAFFIMAVMLLVLLLSVAGVVVIAVVAAVLVGNSGTRAMGLRIFLVGLVGTVITDLLVLMARSNPSVLDRLPRPAQIFLVPFDWAFISPAPIFAYAASSLSGFACAGGAAALVVVLIAFKRKSSMR